MTYLFGDYEYATFQYDTGRYLISTKQSGFIYLVKAPTCSRESYVVEVDNNATRMSIYGLIFGLQEDFSKYYLFDMNTDSQEFRLLRQDPSGFKEIVPIKHSPAIRKGTVSNHLKVIRNGVQITLMVNGTGLGTWTDGKITGMTFVGIATSPYIDLPYSSTYFDNFSVVNLPGSRTASHV